MEQLKGIVTRFTHRNEENGYTVAHFELVDDAGKIKIVGTFPVLEVGETISVTGEWRKHAKHGDQFIVSQYRAEIPVTIKGLKSYLASGAFSGIGPKMAEKLINHFGEDILRIIKEEPQRLAEVPGVGKSKVASIVEGLAANEDHETMIFLQGLGMTPGYAGRILRYYGEDTVNTINANPYILVSDVHGVGFKTADRIAQANGLASDHPERLIAGVKYLLQTQAEDGHCYMFYDQLIEVAAELLGVSADLIPPAVSTLQLKNEVILEKDLLSEQAVYLAPYYIAEKNIAATLAQLVKWQSLQFCDIKQFIKEYEEKQGFILAPEQSKAISAAFVNGVTVITGGPGTGKTTITKCLIELCEATSKQVILAAPTGRAAQRMGEATGRGAKTIHRLLEYAYTKSEGMKFKRNANNKITADVLIIDEVSMVDTLLMYHLTQAIPPGCQVVLVGDIDQLPSVGAGNVLRDIINCEVIPVVRLTSIFRQAQKSLIIVNAHKINAGEFPYLKDKDKDFFFVSRSDPQAIVKTIVSLCRKRLPEFGEYHPLDDIQILTPMRRTVTGVENLNDVLQQALNPAIPGRNSIKIGTHQWREGDKVMQIRNNYRKNVYNGDIGRILMIDRSASLLQVRYQDGNWHRVVDYTFSELNELVLAYAISIHKSQGSEYPVVIIPVTTQHYLMLQRNLIYTGITRAQKLVVLVGTKKALAIAVKNNKVVERHTALKVRLQDEIGGIVK